MIGKNKYGDKKIVKRFAWLPHYLEDGTKIWWEHYCVEQEWAEIQTTDHSNSFYNKGIWVSRRSFLKG